MVYPEVHLLYIWYQQQKRDLPWRDTRDPYTVWVSEIILHQTRVAQGIGYFRRFMETFPNVAALADASQDEVLQLWQGLGYYRRALHMHRAAGVVMSQYRGRMPSDYSTLVTLPGIGDYTASLIASVCQGDRQVAVDGNVGRFISRYFNLEVDLLSSGGKKVVKELAIGFLGTFDPGIINNALMEFGALQCVPRNPDCTVCPLATGCQALAGARVHLLPLRSSRPKVRKRFLLYLVFTWRQDDDVWYLVRQRDEKDIWAMMWEFPGREEAGAIKTESRSVPADTEGWCSLSGSILPLEPEYTYKHQLTHQLIHARFVVFPLPDKPVQWHPSLQAVTADRLDVLAKPVLISRFLSEHQRTL